MTYNPNQKRGGPANPGNWAPYDNSDPEAPLGDTVLCSNCSAYRPRGAAHRCAAPDLVQLTPAAKTVIDAIVAAGGRPLIVGGSVRDAFRGSPSKDIDIEVYGLADKPHLIAALERVGRVDERGVSFGVIAVTRDHEDFDISFPRRDSKTDDTHTGFVVDIDPDLDEVTAFGRRDYTLNALGWDPVSGELVDPWGGLADLEAGVLRHTTAAYTEDALRVLRGVQFCARFNLVFAPETSALARSISNGFTGLAAERVWGEFAKLLTRGRTVSRGLDALHDVGWEHHFPELAAVRDVPQDPRWHPEGPVHVHLGLAADRAVVLADRDGLTGDARLNAVLAAVLHDLGKAGEGTQVHEADGDDPARVTCHGHDQLGEDKARLFLSRLRAPLKVAEHVVPLVRNHMAHAAGGRAAPTKTAVRRLLRRLGDGSNAPTLGDWARLVDADVNGRGLPVGESPGEAWLAVAETVGGQRPSVAILRGQHLLALGWKPSLAFHNVVTASLEAQDDGEFDDESGALVWLAANGERIRAATPVVVSETKAERKSRLRVAKLANRAASTSLTENA